MKIDLEDGFSLIEALVAIAILATAIAGLIGLQATFSKGSADRTVINSLIDAASSALIQCQAEDQKTSFSYIYEDNLDVTVSLNRNCDVPSDECAPVTATASAKGKTFKLTTNICKFK